MCGQFGRGRFGSHEPLWPQSVKRFLYPPDRLNPGRPFEGHIFAPFAHWHLPACARQKISRFSIPLPMTWCKAPGASIGGFSRHGLFIIIGQKKALNRKASPSRLTAKFVIFKIGIASPDVFSNNCLDFLKGPEPERIDNFFA